MTLKTSPATRVAARLIAVALALAWLATDAAWADKTRVGSSRSSGSAKVSGSSARSGGSASRSVVSRSSGSSRAAAPSRGSSRSSSAHGSRGAARTRTGHSYPIREGRGGRYYGGYYSGYYGVPYYWNPWWGGYWGWGVTIGSGYGGYGGYGYYPPVVYSTRPGYRMGALDLSVRPKNAEVYVDGQYVGLAKQYDGFPGHLWLERGVYDVSFYKPGFATETRTVKVMTDLILDIDVDMRPGQAVQPELMYGDDEAVDRDDEISGRMQGPRGELQGRLHVSVEPSNALIYLDGNVLGTGDELAGLRAGLILSAGPHTLEAVRRGFESVERQIVVEPGEELEYELILRPESRGVSP